MTQATIRRVTGRRTKVHCGGRAAEVTTDRQSSPSRRQNAQRKSDLARSAQFMPFPLSTYAFSGDYPALTDSVYPNQYNKYCSEEGPPT
jgi:hypothetical protein